MKRNIFYTFLITLLFIGLAGCDDYFDINSDPNNPTDVPSKQILPYVEVAMSNSVSMGSSGLSNLLSTIMHQTVQRDNVDDYGITPGEFQISQAWDKLYAVCLTDIRQLIDKGTEEGNWHYVAIAQILRVYVYSVLVDVWGEVPYFEAVKGSAAPYPVFDNGRAIYEDLFIQLDEAIMNLEKESELSPGVDDLFYAGDLAKWRKLAKSMKLRLYNNVRLTDLYDASAVNALISEGDLISSAAGDFELRYSANITPENRHPGFILEYTANNPNYFISPYFYLMLRGNNDQNQIYNGISDPRLPYYFYNQLAPGQAPDNPPAQNGLIGRFLSIWFASVNRDPNEGQPQESFQTVVGLYPVGGAYDDGEGGEVDQDSGAKGAGATRILGYFTLLYIQAELALTQGAPGDPRDYFKRAMEASFAEVNAEANSAGNPLISAERIATYVNSVLERYDAANAQEKLEHILTQKWIASFGFAIDTYNDYRRTGYPELFDPNSDNNPFTVLTRQFPVSFYYPTGDLEINPNARLQRDIRTEKVFWDVN